jgi:GT2 family glycosyltransferase
VYALADDPQHPYVSLILVTYNSAELLTPFFTTLATTTYRHYELIVIDNASADSTVADLANWPDLRLIVSPSNEGFGRACNRAAAIARGQMLIFLNPDVTFTPAWLGCLVETMHRDPTVAILCPETLHPTEHPCDSSASRESAAVPGSALMIRHSDWNAIGGFDERIFMYWEDVDLCWRAWLAGRRVLIDGSAIVYHMRGGSGGGGQWAAEAAKNGLYVHLKLMRWRVIAPFLLRLLAKTLLGRPGMAHAWRWNFRNLGATMAARRVWASKRQIDPTYFEALAARHAQAQRRARL